jgi:hypothetical protein
MIRACLLIGVFCVACGGKKDGDNSDKPAPVERASPPAEPKPAEPKPAEPKPAEPKPAEPKPAEPAKPVLAETPSTAPGPTTPEVADAPAGNPPPDGKYERVIVDGVTVPMVSVMNGGTVVLVDTDGKKPRTWEEQYKKKNAKLRGQLDVHKTNTNKNDTFEDDAIDREGMWLLDAKGNLTKH